MKSELTIASTTVELEVVKNSTFPRIGSVEELIGSSQLLKIASCESGLRQFNRDGSVVRGRVNNKDVGILQINEYYHLSTSQKLGYDIYTLEGNIGYGKYLLQTQGTRPWSASAPCWDK